MSDICHLEFQIKEILICIVNSFWNVMFKNTIIALTYERNFQHF